MILHVGERVFWGAPEVIYLEGTIVGLDEEKQQVVMHVERATTHSAHLIGSDLPFAANGVTPIVGESPPGTTDQHSVLRQPAPVMTDDEKIRSAAATAVHQQYGYHLAEEQEKSLIEQVAEVLGSDPVMKERIIASMDEILKREW